MGYKNVLIHHRGYVLGACHTANQWKSLLKWLTACDEIRVFTFDIHLICSENGFIHNLRKTKFVCLRLAYCLSVCNMDRKWFANRIETNFLELDMQLTGIQITLSTCVRPTEVVRVLAFEVQLLFSVYELHTCLPLNNEIRVYLIDI